MKAQIERILKRLGKIESGEKEEIPRVIDADSIMDNIITRIDHAHIFYDAVSTKQFSVKVGQKSGNKFKVVSRPYPFSEKGPPQVFEVTVKEIS